MSEACFYRHQHIQLDRYTEALTFPADDALITTIKRNRSLAYLKTGQYDAALSDTGYPEMGTGDVEKAQFRAAEALYNLARFPEIIPLLEALLRLSPDNKEAASLLERARKRCHEQATGEYDFFQLQIEARTTTMTMPILDVATYTGPVEVKASEGKGRGVFATRAVKLGELLLCEKAFGYIFEKRGDAEPPANFGNDLDMKVRMALLQRDVEKKMHYNPSLAPAFMSLHPSSEDVEGPYRIAQILGHNSFSAPVSNMDEQQKLRNHSLDDSDPCVASGIWVQAAYFNHSCMNDAYPAFIGDLIVVRATSDIEQGEEITISYLPTYGEQTKDTFRSWGFECGCTLCQDLDKTTDLVFQQRKDLQMELYDICMAPPITDGNVTKISNILSKLHSTYTKPKTEVPRLQLWQSEMSLARVYMERHDFAKVLSAAKDVLTSASFIVEGVDTSSTRFKILKWGHITPFTIEPFLSASLAFYYLRAEQDALAAVGYMKITYRILVGEDQSFERLGDSESARMGFSSATLKDPL